MDENASALGIEISEAYDANYEDEDLELDNENPQTVIILEEVPELPEDDETDVECDDLFEENAHSYNGATIDLEGADSKKANLVLCDDTAIEDKIRENDIITNVTEINIPNPEISSDFIDINSLKQTHDSDNDFECVLISDDEDIPLTKPITDGKICKLKNIPEATEETILNEFYFEDEDVCIVNEERLAGAKKILVRMTSQGYRCPLYCTFTVKEQSSMISHLIMHKKSVVMNTNESEAAYQCPMCPFITYFHSAFVKHICYHKKTNVGFFCSQCSFRTMALISLKKHIAMNHASYRFCLNCTFKTRNKKLLKRHQDKCRRPKKSGKMYSCHFDPCPFTAPTEEGLKTHEWIQHQVTASKICSYKCSLDMCHFETFRKELFDEHMGMHSLEELKCQLCNFKTLNFMRFKEHILLHISVP